MGFVPADPLRASIHAIRDAIGDRPFNINFITVFDNTIFWSRALEALKFVRQFLNDLGSLRIGCAVRIATHAAGRSPDPPRLK